MKRLSAATLAEAPARVARPAYDRSAVRRGVVHLGVGAFHRAHQAVFLDDVLAGGDLRWGVTGVSLRSRTAVDQLAPQDGLYTVMKRSGDGEAMRIVGALAQMLPPGDPAPVVAALASPDTHLVTLTITEKGYAPSEPAPRMIATALALRHERGLSAFTAISCDNLPHNGDTLRAAVLAAADGETARWIADAGAFPNAMVDRIVPATTPADRADVARALGLDDQACVGAEPFRQWVIEDRFAGPRPDLAAVGVQLTRDVAPWEAAKLRLLNGAHSAMAYLGQLAGIDFVHRFVADPARRAFVGRLWDESAATVVAPDGLDLAAYCVRLMTRFDNFHLPHRTAQIAVDGTQKLPQRLVAPFLARAEQGEPAPALATAIAAWALWAATASDVDDPQAARLRDAAAADGPFGLLGVLDPRLPLYAAPIATALARLREAGPQAAMAG